VLLCFTKPILGNRYVRSRGFIMSEPRDLTLVLRQREHFQVFLAIFLVAQLPPTRGLKSYEHLPFCTLKSLLVPHVRSPLPHLSHFVPPGARGEFWRQYLKSGPCNGSLRKIQGQIWPLFRVESYKDIAPLKWKHVMANREDRQLPR